MSDDQKLIDSYSLLNTRNEYGESRENMIDDLVLEFGYTPDQAANVYDMWQKAQTK